MTNRPNIGPMLRLVLMTGAMLSPLASRVLKRRLARGKEDAHRWREKLGETDAVRPDGPLVWMHGVGVGEVMALRGLIKQMSQARPDLRFLITSSARSSGDVAAKNLPERTQHQYLPLDFPAPVRAFLDHWSPDLAVWSDQEIWPRMAVNVAKRNTPQAYVAARITAASATARARFGAAYGDVYRLLDLRHAQDADTAARLGTLMGDETPVSVSGSLKAAGAPLAFDQTVKATFDGIAGTRKCWLLASSHPTDEAVALDAQALIRAHDPSALLIIAPRDILRADAIKEAAQAKGLTCAKRSDTNAPDPQTSVYVADTYGELGTWYRSCPVALIGGTFDSTEGHNPWEAVTLTCAVLHGPRNGNFSIDFKSLTDANASLLVTDAGEIAAAVLAPETSRMIARATAVQAEMATGTQQIAQDLLGLLRV